MLTRGSMRASTGADISYSNCSFARLHCLILLTTILIWGRLRLDETCCLFGFERPYGLMKTYCWSGSERAHGPYDTYMYCGSWSGRVYGLIDSTVTAGRSGFERTFGITILTSGLDLNWAFSWHDDTYCLSGSRSTYWLMILTTSLDLSGLSACWYTYKSYFEHANRTMMPVYLPRVCLWAPSRPDDKRSFPAVSETGTLASVASALDAFPCFLEISTTNCRCNPTPAWSCFCIRCPRLQFLESYVNISMHFMYKYLLLSFTKLMFLCSLNIILVFFFLTPNVITEIYHICTIRILFLWKLYFTIWTVGVCPFLFTQVL